MKTIAKEFLYSAFKIRGLLRKYDIPVREPHKGQKDNWNTYGKKNTKKKVTGQGGSSLIFFTKR